MEHLSIGQRIAIARRRRGMSQAQVAGALGRSVQWLSNIERGTRSADRYSVLVPIAEVLCVPVGDLTGAWLVSVELPRVRHAAARSVRHALSGGGFGGLLELNGGGSPSIGNVTELGRRIHEAWRLVHEARYDDFGRIVPGLLRECESAARADNLGRSDARRMLARLYQAVAAMMTKLGETDAAWVAADRSTLAASEAGDMPLAAAGAFRLTHAFLNAGRLDEATQAAGVAIAALEPEAQVGDADTLSLWGALHLVSAICAARANDRVVAGFAIALAEETARRLGPEHVDRRFDTEFGMPNVALHAVAVAVELGDAADAVRRSSKLDTARLSTERRARLLVDVARAHTQRRRSRVAVELLEDAERLAPEMVRNHWLARDTVRELLRRQRGRARRGRFDLAARMGIL